MSIWFERTGPLIKKRHGVLSQNLVKYRRRKIAYHNDRISLKFDRNLTSRQRCCRCVCKISERMDSFRPEYRGYETRYYGKTLFRLVNRCPVVQHKHFAEQNGWQIGVYSLKWLILCHKLGQRWSRSSTQLAVSGQYVVPVTRQKWVAMIRIKIKIRQREQIKKQVIV